MTARHRLILVFVWLAFGVHAVYGTHIRSADISVEAVCGSETFKITITAYVNTTSSSQFGEYDGWLYFGDGSSHDIVETAATPRPDLGVNIGVVVYTIHHTYAAKGTYQIVYREGDRNNGILNMTNSGDTDYISYVIINTDHDFGCNRYPVLDIPPVDRACYKNIFTHVPGVTDADGDSISYELTTPLQSVNTPVNGYVAPQHSKFYTNFNAGNEAGTGPPLFYVDAESGLITWDAPGMVGEYNIAFKIIERRHDPVSNTYVMLSTTVRDMQIVVEDCPNMRPDLVTPANICVEAGTVLSFTITGTDPDNDLVKIEAVSDIFSFPGDESPATYTPFPPRFIASDTVAKLYFKWRTDCMHARQQPYQVTFKITDHPPGGVPLVTFKTWSIKVIAPAPRWKSQSLDLVNRHAKLEWQPYACANASAIQVWRRVGNYPYQGSICETGLPRALGYHLIGQV
ncbi:MAG TPA: gliding motility-associated C-terminal domain-containing protein, partial [Ohtaekwangia sp.]|nr:gliding motility-associated C-terminal domain-containing protein [Ohtaekwangia sp.]